MDIERNDRFDPSAKADSYRRTELEHTANRKSLENKAEAPPPLGQLNPHGCPGPTKAISAELGPPMNIREVASMIGCSVWSVRQKLIPSGGLPHVRLAPRGRIVFYQKQVEAWLLRMQKLQGGKAA
jgi:hypothetical protein